MEDTLERFMKATMVSHENNMAIVKNIEIHMGEIVEQLADEQSGQLSANTQTNPREHCNEIFVGCGERIRERDDNNIVAEKEEKNEKREEKEREKKKSEEE